MVGMCGHSHSCPSAKELLSIGGYNFISRARIICNTAAYVFYSAVSLIVDVLVVNCTWVGFSMPGLYQVGIHI